MIHIVQKAPMIIAEISVEAKELITAPGNNTASGLGLNSVIFFGVLLLLGGITVWTTRNKIAKEPHILILSAVPIVVGLLLVLRNLLASDMFNIGLCLILLSIANIINWIKY